MLFRSIGRVVAMGGWFSQPKSEWNIVCDPVAAELVAAAGVEALYVGIDVTSQCVMTADQLGRLNASSRPIAANLSAAVKLWQDHLVAGGGAWRRPMLHDPLAVATIIRPELVTTQEGTVRVELAGEHTYAQTHFKPAPPGTRGRHRICTAVQAEAFLEFFVERVLSL